VNPSAPGKVPKYWSNERFSCITMMMCLIFPPLGSVVLTVLLEDVDTLPERVAMEGPPLVHATNTTAATAVATASVRRVDVTADISGRSPRRPGGAEHSEQGAPTVEVCNRVRPALSVSSGLP
jgi:hypothetical protein